MADSAVLLKRKEKSESKLKTTGKKRKKDVSNSFRKLTKNNKMSNFMEINESKENNCIGLTSGKVTKSECLCPALQVPLKKKKHGSKRLKEKDRDNNVMMKKKRRNSYLDTSAEKISTVYDNETNNEVGEELRFNDLELSNTPNVIISSGEESGNPLEADKVYWEGYSPLHHIRSGNKNEIEKILEKGYQRKIGRWTQDEIEQLNKNISEFLENNEVKDFWGLIDARTKEDRQLRKKTDFVRKMCKGILRTGVDVDKKVYKHFGKSFLKTGKYDDIELKQLRRLQCKYGNDWKAIGTILNRSKNNLGNVFEHHKTWDKGEWSYYEDKTLLSLVVGFKEKNETVSWNTCSEELKTRSRNQCLRRWSRHYSHIDTRFAFEKWLANRKKEDLVIVDSNFQENEIYKLITIISDLNIDDEFLIEWNELSKHFENVPSAAWLKLKFQAVCKEVPHSHRLEFSEIIEQLIEIYEKKVNKGVDHAVGEANDVIRVIDETDDDIEIIDSADDDYDNDDDDDVQIIELDE